MPHMMVLAYLIHSYVFTIVFWEDLKKSKKNKNRGFNSDEENMLAEFDDDWG